jgi:hypothetical protein
MSLNALSIGRTTEKKSITAEFRRDSAMRNYPETTMEDGITGETVLSTTAPCGPQPADVVSTQNSLHHTVLNFRYTTMRKEGQEDARSAVFGYCQCSRVPSSFWTV